MSSSATLMVIASLAISAKAEVGTPHELQRPDDRSDAVSEPPRPPSAEDRRRLCREQLATRPASLPMRKVRVEAVDSWGDPALAVLVEDGTPISTLPAQHTVPECLESLRVRFLPDGPEVDAAISGDTAIARSPGLHPLSTVSGIVQVSWVYPGWGDGTQVHLSGGVRLATWRHWLHADVAIKLSSFNVPWLLKLPGGLALDAFIGFPVSFAFQRWDLRLAVDVGAWSTFCPTVRLSGSAHFGRWALTLDYSAHIYPMALFPQWDRPVAYVDVPFQNFVFWSAGLAFGAEF